MIRLIPCVELYRDSPDCADWPTIASDAPSFLHLTGDVTSAEVGSATAAIARYNTTTNAPSGDRASTAMLRAMLEREHIVIPGGILALNDQTRVDITPGCCCGLEDWRAWVDFLDDGLSPWTGHDPAPELELRDETVYLSSDAAGIEGVFTFSMTRDEYAAQLASVEQHLADFTRELTRWAETVVPDIATPLVARLRDVYRAEPPHD